MAGKPTHLHAVPDDPPPARPPDPPKTLIEAVEWTERELLVAMRQKVARELDAGVPAHALAPLMKQMRDIDRDIRALDLAAKEDAEHGGEVPDEAFDATAI